MIDRRPLPCTPTHAEPVQPVQPIVNRLHNDPAAVPTDPGAVLLTMAYGPVEIPADPTGQLA
jgi:hypothetical protein